MEMIKSLAEIEQQHTFAAAVALSWDISLHWCLWEGVINRTAYTFKVQIASDTNQSHLCGCPLMETS